jgi:hypothetical protein
MRRLGFLFVAGMVVSLVSSSDAQACHKKKCAEPCAVAYVAPAPCPEPAPCVMPAPCPEPAPCAVACEPAPKKKCGLFGGGGGLFSCMKKKSHCEPAPVMTCATAPVYYTAAPVYAAPQHYATPQYAAPQQ